MAGCGSGSKKKKTTTSSSKKKKQPTGIMLFVIQGDKENFRVSFFINCPQAQGKPYIPTSVAMPSLPRQREWNAVGSAGQQE